MKIFLLFLLFLSFLQGEVPRKKRLNDLRTLWENSPFTIKPIKTSEEKDQLKDWALAGVSKHPMGGYTVTIVNKKDRNDRRRIQPQNAGYADSNAGDFRVLEVNSGGFDYKKTKV